MAQKILLFLGAGLNVGSATVAQFKSEGYKIASVARTIKPEIKANSDMYLSADFTNPATLGTVFDEVRQSLGTPNVVIYNPFAWGRGPDPSNPLFPTVEHFQSDLNINTVSAYAAAKFAVEGFESLPHDVKKTFIVTGNNGNTAIMPNFLSLGLGKSATWYLVQQLAATYSYASKGYQFYYVDERTPEGKALTNTSGPAHAKFFLELTGRDQQGAILATFVRGKGYTSFPASESASLPRLTVPQAVDFRYGAPGTAEADII